MFLFCVCLWGWSTSPLRMWFAHLLVVRFHGSTARPPFVQPSPLFLVIIAGVFGGSALRCNSSAAQEGNVRAFAAAVQGKRTNTPPHPLQRVPAAYKLRFTGRYDGEGVVNADPAAEAGCRGGMVKAVVSSAGLVGAVSVLVPASAGAASGTNTGAGTEVGEVAGTGDDVGSGAGSGPVLWATEAGGGSGAAVAAEFKGTVVAEVLRPRRTMTGCGPTDEAAGTTAAEVGCAGAAGRGC